MGVVTEPRGLPLLSEYPAFVRRHRLLLAALVGVGLLVGLGLSFVRPATYSATASISLPQVPKYLAPADAGLPPPGISIDTDAQLLQSPRVLRAVASVLSVDPERALDHLTVTASSNTHVLHVTVTADKPAEAAQAANDAAAALTVVRRRSLGALRADQLRMLRLRISSQEKLLAREQTRQLLIPQYDDLFAQLLALREGLYELQNARALPAEVIQPAEPAARADYANHEVPVVSGLMVGLLLGCLLGTLRDRAGTRQRAPFTLASRVPSLSLAPSAGWPHPSEG